MSSFTLLVAIAGLAAGLIALSRGKRAGERADDSMRYLSDLRNSSTSNINELFIELNRVKVKQLKAEGSIKKIPYEITTACVACGACEPECPTEAIRPDEIYRIIPELCKPCKKCAQACPVDACVEMVLE